MKKINPPSNRNFGIVFFLVFMVIAMWPLLNFGQIKIWSIVVSLIFLVLGIFNSKILTPFNKLWMKFGLLLGNIISPIIMGIIFFLIVTPIGILMKIFGKDPLNLKNKNSSSYWIKKNKTKSSMKNQF